MTTQNRQKSNAKMFNVLVIHPVIVIDVCYLKMYATVIISDFRSIDEVKCK